MMRQTTLTTTTATTTTTEQKFTKCGLCGLDGIMMPVEFLPKAGVVMKVIHKRGNECKWARYGSIEEIGIYPDRKRSPRIITCPKCGKEGIVNEWQPDRRRPEHIVYYVRHGKIQYGQGNSRKQDRCFITDETQRDKVLRQIGRYIERPNVDLSPKKITCPRCGTVGKLGAYHPDKKRRPGYVKHYVDHKENRCIISDPEHKKLVESKLAKDRYIMPTLPVLKPKPIKQPTTKAVMINKSPIRTLEDFQLIALLAKPKPKIKPKHTRKHTTKKHARKMINCPQCHTRGILNVYHANKKNKPECVNFYVQHKELIGGTYGRQKIPKRKRCMIRNEFREIITSKLKNIKQ